MKILRNPVSFTTFPVTFFTCVTYVALLAPLVVIHERVPPVPSEKAVPLGINLTEAWNDLQHLSNGFHPYNSRRNDAIRDWLLLRIEAILAYNNASFHSESTAGQNSWERYFTSSLAPVVIFNDRTSNITFSSPGSDVAVYFEGTNVIIYIRGTQKDEQLDWWKSASASHNSKYNGTGGILVNAHYDSVSSGYGATDDGVGVVSLLQLISYFTREKHRPRRGIVALFNNGEEDYLNGANAFTKHPIAQFPRIFLNLEGAGAGGRAALFRSTDTEVTRFYKRTNRPFGTVLSADGFKQGLVKSETDYAVFTQVLGLRGLDVAFIGPRSRYHTTEDDTRDTSKRSLWHMLSASLHTVEAMSKDTSNTFDRYASNNDPTHEEKIHGTVPVWFDLFGRSFALLELHSLFAISVTLLVATPLVLIALVLVLKKLDRWYLFTRYKYRHSADNDDAIPIKGNRGFFRYPIALTIASGAVIGVAFLLAKFNPQIVQSSPFSVWVLMLTTWFIVVWFLLRGAAITRPSAFDRVYALLWIYALFFIVTTAATVLQRGFQISGVYFLVIYFAASFISLLVAYLELLALPPMSQYAQDGVHSPTVATPEPEHIPEEGGVHEEGVENATESTSLLGNDGHQSFARYGSNRNPHPDEEVEESHVHSKADDRSSSEQDWSKSLPESLWLLEFLLLAPIVIILVGQVSLFITAALPQTLSDGGPVLPLYIDMAILSVLLLLPLSPFINRITYALPVLLFAILVGTMIYNLIMFPFSRDARLKIRFGQHVDVDTGINTVYLSGLPDYTHGVTAKLPSSFGQEIDCRTTPTAFRTYNGLTTCGFSGLAPHILYGHHKHAGTTIPPQHLYKDWLSFDANRTADRNEAVLRVSGRNTKACRLNFDRPVSHLHVRALKEAMNETIVPKNAASNIDAELSNAGDNFNGYSLSSSIEQVRLWSRDWDGEWEVHIRWDGDGHQRLESTENEGKTDIKDNTALQSNGDEASDFDLRDDLVGLDGRVACLWSDANEKEHTMPAFDEALRFVPVWVGLTKMDDGLVVGSKRFSV